MKQPTGYKSNSDLLQGDKLYIERARQTLPILVRQAKSGEPIYYSDLAQELEMPNPRNLNYVLGAIGNALEILTENENIPKIPLVNCLVINKSDNLPGDGINWFIDKKNFDKLPKNQKRETVKLLLIEIYAYPHWDWVLNELGLNPIKINFEKNFKPQLKAHKFGVGESQQHIDFKNYLAKNPSLFGLSDETEGQIEYEFPSGDLIDVIFVHKSEIIGVEAKSIISGSNDILRGLFQCIKYKALIEAEQKVNDLIPNCHVILALEGNFPKKLIEIKNTLGIEVKENIKNVKSQSN